LSEALAIAMERGWTLTHKGSLRTLTAPDGRGWICVTSDDVWAVLRVAGIVEGGIADKHRQAEYEARRAYLEEHGLPGNDPVAFAEACTGRKLAPMPDYSDLPDGVLSPEGEAERFRGLAGLAAREHHATESAAAKPKAEASRDVTVTLTREQYDLVVRMLELEVSQAQYEATFADTAASASKRLAEMKPALVALKAQGGAK
ncbi:hypothetical protein EBT16_10035, partial [bacterium]|nr:hypothetical protein [bacterium]